MRDPRQVVTSSTQDFTSENDGSCSPDNTGCTTEDAVDGGQHRHDSSLGPDTSDCPPRLFEGLVQNHMNQPTVHPVSYRQRRGEWLVSQLQLEANKLVPMHHMESPGFEEGPNEASVAWNRQGSAPATCTSNRDVSCERVKLDTALGQLVADNNDDIFNAQATRGRQVPAPATYPSDLGDQLDKKPKLDKSPQNAQASSSSFCWRPGTRLISLDQLILQMQQLRSVRRAEPPGFERIQASAPATDRLPRHCGPSEHVKLDRPPTSANVEAAESRWKCLGQLTAENHDDSFNASSQTLRRRQQKIQLATDRFPPIAQPARWPGTMFDSQEDATWGRQVAAPATYPFDQPLRLSEGLDGKQKMIEAHGHAKASRSPLCSRPGELAGEHGFLPSCGVLERPAKGTCHARD